MRHRHLIRFGMIGVLAASIVGSAASAQTDSPSATSRAHKRHAPPPARVRTDSAPLICTKGRCAPLPAHCHAETEFTWEGPTGYQFIVCP